MPVTITDEMLSSAGLSEGEARLEIACRLYAAGKLGLSAAARWAGLNRTSLEAALVERGLPLVRVEESYWDQEQAGMQRLGW
jgi:predicted HTH domain antitoxin